MNGRYWEDPRVHVLLGGRQDVSADRGQEVRRDHQRADQPVDRRRGRRVLPGVSSRPAASTSRRAASSSQWIQGYELEDSDVLPDPRNLHGRLPVLHAVESVADGHDARRVARAVRRRISTGWRARVKTPGVQRDLATHRHCPRFCRSSGSRWPTTRRSRRTCTGWARSIRTSFRSSSTSRRAASSSAPRRKAVKMLDRRTQSPANAKLWVQDYLNGWPVSAG